MPDTRNQILNEALEIVGAKALGQAANPEDLLSADNTLRQMVDRWQAAGAHLFNQNEATLFLAVGQVKYQLGNSSTDHATEVFTETTLSADAAASATTASLTSTTGLAIADNLGFRLTDGTMHWTTVTTVTPLLFTPALASAAASGNTVFYYTTDLEKALRVPDARRRDGSGSTAQEIEMVVYGKNDYQNLPNKTTSGTPTIFYYDPKQLHGEMFIWASPTSSTDLVKFTYYKPLSAYDSASDQGDFPSEWAQTVTWNLVVLISVKFPGYDLPPMVLPMAQAMYNDLKDWDTEDASVSFQPNYSW